MAALWLALPCQDLGTEIPLQGVREEQVRGREDRLVSGAGALRPACLKGKLLISFRRHIVIAADGFESHRFLPLLSRPCCQGGEVPTPAGIRLTAPQSCAASSVSSPHWQQRVPGTAAMIRISPPPRCALCPTCSVFLPGILAVGIP